MLIQILFYVLMLFGVAALAVDMGLMRLTQRQMQNVADAAAMEGLRQRDVTLDTACISADPDQNRRCAATNMAANFEGGPQIAITDDPAFAPGYGDYQPSKIDFQTTVENPAYNLSLHPLQTNLGTPANFKNF